MGPGPTYLLRYALAQKNIDLIGQINFCFEIEKG